MLLVACISKELASKGCNLFLISKSENKLKKLQEQIKKECADVDVFYNPCDLLDI